MKCFTANVTLCFLSRYDIMLYKCDTRRVVRPTGQGSACHSTKKPTRNTEVKHNTDKETNNRHRQAKKPKYFCQHILERAGTLVLYAEPAKQPAL